MTTRLSRWLRLLGDGSPSLLLGGLSMTLLICLARMTGLLEGIELRTLDVFLRWRPPETVDERITILEFTEADIQALGTHLVPDDVIYQLLLDLRACSPRVMGLDIYRDIPSINPRFPNSSANQVAYKALLDLLQRAEDIVVIERILEAPVSAPPGVPREQVGFADALVDEDGFVRRSLLGVPNLAEQTFSHSLTLQLARKYLAAEGIELTNGLDDKDTIRFGSTEFFRLRSDSGGYFDQDTGNNPVVLINFRSHEAPFRRVSFSEFQSGQVSPEWFRDRIVLIGMTAPSTKDYVNSAAMVGNNPGLVLGIDLQAHAVSQILSAVLDERPILKPWATPWEYFGIVVAGLLGISLVQIKRSLPLSITLFIGLSTVPLLAGYGLLLVGIWLPTLPIWLAFALTGGSAMLYQIYQHEQSWKIRLSERQKVIKQSYDAIHNRPLQTLKQLIRDLSSQDQKPTLQILTTELNKVDQELRDIYEFMHREHHTLDSRMYLTQSAVMNLNDPLHELLHQVYQNQLQELSGYFETVKIKMPDFCPINSQWLSLENKEGIIRFLEEALCNVALHACQVTRLAVTCKQTDGNNIVRVVDNGIVSSAKATPNGPTGGRGTRQAQALAHRLGGCFLRYSPASGGTVCQLSWPVSAPSIWVKLQRSLQIAKSSLFD